MKVKVEPFPTSEFEPDLAAVHLYDALRDREAEAGATLLLSDGVVSLLELFEQLLLI